jgi:RNA polymerase sigma-70 factor (ECF subfamily)
VRPRMKRFRGFSVRTARGAPPTPPMVVPGIYDVLSDVELTTAMAHGRKEALAEIYDRYGSSVYALARRLCAGEAAKDVTHEVFLALWQTPKSFDPDRGSLHSHLLAVAHHCAVSRVRSGEDGRLDEARGPLSQHHDKGSEALAMCDNEDFRALLADLSDHQRHAILLAYFGGYTYRQVAERLLRSEERVKIDIGAGLTRLRAKVAVD